MPPRKVSQSALALLALAGLAGVAYVELDTVFPHRSPRTAIPPPHPQSTAPVDSQVTASLPHASGLAHPGPIIAPSGPALAPPGPVIAPPVDDAVLLREGLDALSKNDLDAARTARDGMPADSLDRRILAWAIATGGYGVSSAEIDEAARALDGWPATAALARNRERAILRENPDPQAVVAMFATTSPLTQQGARMLARAKLALGDEAGAHATIAAIWRNEKLEAADEKAILAEFGAILTIPDHRARIERMLYAERTTAADRVATLAGATALNKAWAAVIRNDKTAGKLLDGVPGVERSAGYVFAKARYLRRAGKYEQAAALMLEAPTEAKALIDPDAWWVERRVLARELLDLGKPKIAYKLVEAHAAESPAMVADAEFHAGWMALRHLHDAKAASRHFSRIATFADGAISLSRAYYWLGRAAEAGGPGDATAYFERAASNGSAFYGQLAAAKLGLPAIPVNQPEPSAEDRQRFESSDAIRAILRLQEAGFDSRADAIYRELAQQLTNPGELSLLASMAATRGNHYLALRIGKFAASRGIAVGALTHPTGAIPASAEISGAGMALAYAIARQESEFNVGAVSGAGAQGLLQLMPNTAKDMAKKAGMPFSAHRLTSDAAYNATLGSEFLSDQLGRFTGSYVLTFAGYNAGPKRVTDWIKRYGDPRGKPIDEVVDWVERIPFTETRHYVQRVMENYQVYKMRLTGSFDIAGDLVNGR